MDVWNEVLTGIALVAGSCWLLKTIYQWNLFRKSIYVEIYSSYIEYAFRKKNLVRLSESFFLKNELGKHRIFYQIAKGRNESIPQAYVVLILSTGIYIMNIKNQYQQSALKKTLLESGIFESRIRQRIGAVDIPMKSIVVFPQSCSLNWSGSDKQNITVVKRKDAITAIRKNAEKSSNILSDQQIDQIYHQLADEFIEMEKGYC